MVDSNNAINNTVGASITGVTNTLTVTNPSDTASSAARETITVGGSSAGDPSLNFNVSGVTDFEMGIDNGDSDKLKISQGTALGTNDTWEMTTSGERTMPLQPRFLAYLSADVPNVTGDGTTYPVVFDSESFDVGGIYDNATGIFTAPVDGVYCFGVGIDVYNMNAAHQSLLTSLGDADPAVTFAARVAEANPYLGRNVINNTFFHTSTVILNMTAGDTLSAFLIVAGGTKTVGIRNVFAALVPAETFFYGYLLC